MAPSRTAKPKPKSTTAPSPLTVSLADEKAVREIVSNAVLDLWKIVNNLARLRPSARERYRVAIFGSARAQPGSDPRLALASSEDLQIPQCVDTADQAIALIRERLVERQPRQ